MEEKGEKKISEQTLLSSLYSPAFFCFTPFFVFFPHQVALFRLFYHIGEDCFFISDIIYNYCDVLLRFKGELKRSAKECLNLPF